MSNPSIAAPTPSWGGAREESRLLRLTLISLAIVIVGVLVLVPMVNVFYEALRRGPQTYWDALVNDPDTLSAIGLTLTVAPAAVFANVLFGLAAAWTIARFQFPGRRLLISLIDLPFAVSPVVAGLIFVLIFGLQGLFGPWLREHDIKIIFNTPGLILATAFVTFPFVARELIPLMEAIGSEEEIAAVNLGARARHLLLRVTLPNVKWGLLYGIILCNARAMGEFGAVYVVSGHISGQTDTMPLRVEKLFQEYNTAGSFALASLLSSLALVTLAVKTALEWQTKKDLNSRNDEPPGATVHRSSATTSSREVRSSGPRIEPSFEDRRSGISVRNVTKRFGDFTALDNINLEVPDGALLALLGPSGSGKTTLLRIIAGLEQADSGSIHYHEEEATNRSPRDRNVGFVFQHYALFRHMTVFENVTFGLRVRKWPEEKIRGRVHELLQLVQLDNLAKQYPSQLSGGQRQRIALARSLAPEPKLLLLDEPFGALDAKVRQELRQWLRRLHDEIHVTSVFVTHDQEEAFEVSDRVVVMNHGRIEQIGSPEEVFEHPANDFVMDFLGNVNLFHGRIEEGRAHLGGLEVAMPEYSDAGARPIKAYIRPHELDVSLTPPGPSSLKAEVLRLNPAGSMVKIELLSADFGLPLLVELTQERYREVRCRQGDIVFVSPKRVRVFVQGEGDFQI